MSEEATVSTPKSFSFKDVNHWVHVDAPEYEELQGNALGMASAIDALQARIAELEKDAGRYRWLLENKAIPTVAKIKLREAISKEQSNANG